MNPEKIKIWALIPAAGIGKRVGSTIPKQYLQLADKTVLEHSIDKLLSCDAVVGLVVGIAENDFHWNQLDINHPRFLGDYPGGKERIHTVLNGLDFLQTHASENDWVLVHDAVRPCVDVEDIERLIRVGLNSECGVILANKVVDTVKQISCEDEIQQTLNRNELALAATPQLFPINLLKKALNQALKQEQLSTDESAAVEALGLKPLIVEGKRTNIKITTPDDLELMKFIFDKAR